MGDDKKVLIPVSVLNNLIQGIEEVEEKTGVYGLSGVLWILESYAKQDDNTKEHPAY